MCSKIELASSYVQVWLSPKRVSEEYSRKFHAKVNWHNCMSVYNENIYVDVECREYTYT